MTDEEKRELIAESQNTGGGTWMESVIKKVEAKLSPKYSPKGRLVKIWDDSSAPWYCVSDGGREIAETIAKWDHYREITTARDVMDMFIGHRWENKTWGIAVQDLIDNAQEG